MQQLESAGTESDKSRFANMLDTALSYLIGNYATFLSKGSKAKATAPVIEINKYFVVSGSTYPYDSKMKYLKRLLDGLIKSKVLRAEGTEHQYQAYRQNCTVQEVTNLLYEYFDETTDIEIMEHPDTIKITRNVPISIPSSSDG